MRHPFQFLQAGPRSENPWGYTLLAAAGSRINLFRLSNGDSTLLSTLDIGTLAAIQGTSSQSAQPIERNESDQRLEGKLESSSQAATILTITATQRGDHVIVVTGEDKCIRVFKVRSDGHFHLLSAR